MAPLGPFEDNPHIAAAVSGGADSLALALLLHDWARPLGGRVTALTVDHGLRPAAAAEARFVARTLGSTGVIYEPGGTVVARGTAYTELPPTAAKLLSLRATPRDRRAGPLV